MAGERHRALSDAGRLLRALAWLIRSTYEADKGYYRRLIVRAIEDAAVLLGAVVAIWTVCTLVGGIFRALGVGT